MTKKQVLKKFRQLHSDLRRFLNDECERLLDSGGIDYESHNNDYHLPKILMTVALLNASQQYAPFEWDKTGAKAVKNLRRC